MSLTFFDATAGESVMTADNSANFNVGPGTPASQLSVNGKAVIASGVLVPNTVPSGALIRFAGSVTIAASGTATVSGAAFAGIGSVSGDGILYSFAVGSSFSVANPSASSAQTFNYAVL